MGTHRFSKKSDDDELLRAIGESIRVLRRTRLGISQEELAHRSGLTRSYLGHVERGSQNISLANLLRVCKALGSKPSDLLLLAEQLHDATK